MPNGDVLSHFARTYSETALVLEPNMTREAWIELGDWLHRIERGIQWWLADWWNYGERRWGEGASQAADAGVNLGTVQNAAWVGRQFPPERRREHLSFAHHQAAAPLEAEQADTWLDKAEGEGMTVAELRARIKAEQNGGDSTSETMKLLRRAAEAYRRDNPLDGVADFCRLADEAWQAVHGLAGDTAPQPS